MYHMFDVAVQEEVESAALDELVVEIECNVFMCLVYLIQHWLTLGCGV